MHRLPFSAPIFLLTAAFSLSSCDKKASTVKTTPGEQSQLNLGPLPVETISLTAANQLRLVWVRTAEPNTSDSFAEGSDLLLIGTDTGDNGGIRQLQPKGSFFRPLFLPGGQEIIYTDRSSAMPQIKIFTWPAAAPRILCTGVALATWRNNVDLSSWIICLEETEPSARGGLVGKMVTRFRPESPNDKEIIWTETPIEAQSFQLSADGNRAAALIPAPLAGLLNLEDHTLKKLGDGTWPSMAGDDSYAVALLDTPMSTLQIFVPNQPEPWPISLASIGGMDGKSAWQPRWSNDSRFFAFSGPYPKPPDDPSFDPKKDGVSAEIFLCRLGAGGSEIQSAIQLTKDDHGDYFPDVFTYGAPLPFASLEQKPKDKSLSQPKPWPSTTDGLCFAWINLSQATTVSERTCKVTPSGLAYYNRDKAMDLTSGIFTADQPSADTFASQTAQSNEFTVEAIITESFTGSENLSLKLMGLSGPDLPELLGLYRMDNKLILRMELGPAGGPSLNLPVKLVDFRVGHDEPYHLTLTAKQGHLQVWQNGNQISEITLESPQLGCWAAGGKLTFGDLAPFDDGRWKGSIHQTAFYSKALPVATIAAHYEAAKQKFSNRRPTDSLLLRGQLQAAPIISTTDKDCLIPLTYIVQKINSGILAEKEITVFHWAKLNGNACPGLPKEVGASYDLLVEPLTQHPEIQKDAQIAESTPKSRQNYLSIAPVDQILTSTTR